MQGHILNNNREINPCLYALFLTQPKNIVLHLI